MTNANIPEAEFVGDVTVGSAKIPCAVLYHDTGLCTLTLPCTKTN